MRRSLPLFILGLFLAATMEPALAENPDLIDDFEGGLSSGWAMKGFHGQTDYAVVPEGSGHVLHAYSRAAASGLFFKREYDLHDAPFLSWRWKVANIIPGGDESQKSGDDFSARIYVVFPHWFFPKTRTISYVWGNRLKVGAFVPSPYTKNAMLLAVESGTEKVGTWIVEKRNVLEDYRRLFGEEPPLVGAIAVMTDTDDTGTSAEAWYDDLRIERPAR